MKLIYGSTDCCTGNGTETTEWFVCFKGPDGKMDSIDYAKSPNLNSKCELTVKSRDRC